MKKTTNPEHTDLIVENNPNLKNFTKTSPTFDNISKPPLPETKDFDKEFELYVKFIPNKDTRKHIEDNKDTIKEFKKIYSKDQEDARDLKGMAANEEYDKAIAEVKEHLPTRTQEIIKQRVMGSCITGLAKYFDTTTINAS